MLTQNLTETALPASAGMKLVLAKSARSLRNMFTELAAHSLNRRYLLGEELLSGSQYVLRQASDSVGNRDCSVKMLSSAVTNKELAEWQLQHEAQVLARFSHPNVAELYECSRDEEGNLFSVMELLTGRDLHSLLAEVSRLTVERTLEILRSLGAALQHAHDRGFIHADLNPRNVFLHQELSGTAPAGEVVKVLNFGLARRLSADKQTTKRNLHLDLIFDAPTYLAPEALELSSKAVDERADQWSLAVLAYQMLSGQLPFYSKDSWRLRALIRASEGPTPLAVLVPSLPSHVSAAIERALAKEKSQRFGSVTDFIRALDGLPVATTRPTKPELRVDLIERCRPVSDRRAAAPTVLPPGSKTREYPVLSFPAELLAAAEKENSRLPAPRLTPSWTGGEKTPQRLGTVPQLGLVLCILMALIPAATAWHLMHPVARVRALFHHHPVQAMPSQPAPVALPEATACTPLPPAATLAAHAETHKHKHAQSHHGRTRAARKPAPKRSVQNAYRSKSRARLTQEVLKEGLGL